MSSVMYPKQVGFTVAVQLRVNNQKSANVIFHDYNLKKENPVNIATDTEKTFDIIQYPFTSSD